MKRLLLLTAIFLSGCAPSPEPNQLVTEAQQSKVTERDLLMFCKEISEYGSNEVSSLIIYAEAAEYGLNSNSQGEKAILDQAINFGRLSILKHQAGVAVDKVMSGFSADSDSAKIPQRLMVNGCFESLMFEFFPTKAENERIRREKEDEARRAIADAETAKLEAKKAKVEAENAKVKAGAEAKEEAQRLHAETLQREKIKKFTKGATLTESGLAYRILKKGSGPKPNIDSTVEVHYSGRLLDCIEFDNSVKRGVPAQFGVTQVISGWTEVLLLMPEGSKWKVYIPAEMAYGSSGSGGVIGPNQDLIFDIELIQSNVE